MLDTFLETVERERKRFTVYTPEGDTDLTDGFATRNVTVERRSLPSAGPDPFVTIHDGEEFAGAIALADFEELLTPPVVRPSNPGEVSDGYRALFDVLAESVFSSLDRRQLLVASREIEDRAFRVGHGTLRVCFQSLSTFESQVPVYERLGTGTDLDIHIYGRPDWSPPAIENVTYHSDTDGSLAPFWCVAFDGGDDEMQACVLVARERDDGYVGFWSYDPDLVADVLRTIETAAD